MPKKIAVIDGNSLMHRAYHAVPPSMNAPDGTPTNAVFGFMSMFLKFVEIANPDAIVCAFDAGRPAFRMEALEQYKAQRPPMDEDLRVQFPLIEKLLSCMNIPVVRISGWEGDDILGTVAARDEELGYETLLVTGDKDAYQLASELTKIVTTKKGITDVVVYGPEEVFKRYGVTPGQFPDFLGLKGDSSDNIPGVPGIGDKTAAKLLSAYGSLEGIYENLDKLKGKQLENLVNNKDAAFTSRQVATIVRDVEFPLDLEETKFPDFDPDKLTEGFRELSFNAHLAKVLSLVGAEAAPQAPVVEAGEILPACEWESLVEGALDEDEPVAVAFSESPQASLFESALRVALVCGEKAVFLEGEQAVGALVRVVKDCRFVALETKKLLRTVYPPDSGLPAFVDEDDVRSARFFDVALAAYALNSSADDYELPTLVESYFQGSLPESDDAAEALVVEARAVAALAEALRGRLDADGTLDAYERIDVPLVGVLAIIERTGAALDVKRLNELSKEIGAKADDLRARIVELAGEDFNVDSPKQLGHILFEVIGLKPLKKTQRGYSTNAQVLKELSKEHEMPGLVLSYREFAKIKSTYLDALPKLRGADGRVHTTFNETVTTTGRLSSSDPNLQNIPVRTEFGRQIRECFIPLEEGHVFLSADYSQIELRLLAHLSGDEGLIEAFCSGADFHSQTASRVFGIPVEEVTAELRSRAKAVNFGIVYGQQAFGLSQSLDIPFGEAKEMIDRYFAAYPGVREYLDRTVEEARACGYASTMFGRKRHIPELNARNANLRGFGERTAMNHPMQGSAADIIKLAMAQVDRKLAEGDFKARLLLQVHDELDFSVPAEEVESVAALVKEAMEGVVKCKVPLVADVSWGDNWAQAH